MKWASLLALFALAGSARAEEQYYVVLFGSEKDSIEARYAHSFATFVRAAGPGCVLEAHNISWLPRTLDVHLFRALPEPGVNLGLHATLRYALANHERVSMWGPFRIERTLYERALAQARRLEGGAVRYKAVDTGYPTRRVSNCIHALSDLAEEEPRLRVGTPWFGEVASYLIALQFERWIIDPEQTHPWVAEALGLGGYPIIPRDLERRHPLARRRPFPAPR